MFTLRNSDQSGVSKTLFLVLCHISSSRNNFARFEQTFPTLVEYSFFSKGTLVSWKIKFSLN